MAIQLFVRIFLKSHNVIFERCVVIRGRWKNTQSMSDLQRIISKATDEEYIYNIYFIIYFLKKN